jgi:Zn-dependent protease
VGLLSDPAGAVMNLIVLLLSLTVHEFAHAWSAWRLGDDTAARMGRLTLNPVPHIDPLGTLLLPLMGAPIGWAKPVPVNPARFTRGLKMGTGDILVSVAGPLSNIALGFVAAGTFALVARFAPELVGRGEPAGVMLGRFMLVNASLAIFNLLPIAPLDGSHVAEQLVPYRHREAWAKFAAIGPFILLGLIALQSFAGIGILWAIIGPPRDLIVTLYSRIALGLV